MESPNVDKTVQTAAVPADKQQRKASTAVPHLEGTTTAAPGVNLDEAQAEAAAIAPPKKKKEQKEKPLCACGCNTRLTSSNPNRIFLQGHDAKCKKSLRLVADGEESPRSVSRWTAENAHKMGFLKKDSELARAMTEVKKAHNIK